MKIYSEADMGSMRGYDPNLGLGKRGMRKLQTSTPLKLNRTNVPIQDKMSKPRIPGGGFRPRIYSARSGGASTSPFAMRSYKKFGKLKKTGGEAVLNFKQKKKVGRKNLKRAVNKLYP